MFDKSTAQKLTFDIIKILIIPVVLGTLWLSDLIALTTVKISLLICFVVFIVFPIIFKYSYSVQRALLFLTFISYPKNLDLSKPEKSGLYGARNFYITYKDEKGDREISLGVWHILPNHVVNRFGKYFNVSSSNVTISDEAAELQRKNHENYAKIEEKLEKLENNFNVYDNEATQKLFFEEILKSTESPVIFYLHGNTGSRGATHRVELYQRLRSLGFHVIAFDYRGYGDSTKYGPSSRAVRLDATMVFQYIVNLTDNHIILWGHSLGTGIGTLMMAELQGQLKRSPIGIILESPFNNIREEITEHPFARLYRHLPWFDYTIVNPMQANKLTFDSDTNIRSIKEPIMILHAEDDPVVPFNLGYKLYRTALDTRPKSYGPIEFHRFAKTTKYGHKFICRAPELSDLVLGFFNKHVEL